MLSKNQNKPTLTVVGVAEKDDGTFIKTSSDGRRYMTVYFQPDAPDGLLTNAKARGKNIWEEGPNGSAGDPLFNQLLKEDESDIKKGAKVIGEVQTVEVEEYFIPNEYGKYTHPETGEPANKANTYTSVVFEDENIVSMAENQGHKIAGKEEAESIEEQEQNQEVPELATEG